jgi:RNA recognition motif-containing protein
MDIYVGNLPYQTNDEDLRELFSAYGNVSSARVIMDKFSGQSRGFGFVEMPDKAEGETAIQNTNGADFQGRALRVNESQPKPRDERGGGGGGRGGGGGGRGPGGDRGGR